MDRPDVVVSVPGGDDRPPEVLDGGDGSPAPRRLVAVLVGLAVVLAAVAGGGALREQRAEQAEERRAQSVVDLERTDRWGAGPLQPEVDAATGEATATFVVGVRNQGPRELVLVEASLGELRQTGEVTVPPGGDSRLLLQQRLPCTEQPARGSGGEAVQLRVRTASGEERTVPLRHDVPVEAAQLAARRACSYLEPQEALGLLVLGEQLVSHELRVDVTAFNAGRLPLRLTRLAVTPGLAAAVEQDGDPVRLPLALPPETVTGERSTVELLLRLSVDDCSRVDTERLDEGAGLVAGDHGVVTVTLVGPQDDEVAVSFPLVRYRTPLRRLVAEACA